MEKHLLYKKGGQHPIVENHELTNGQSELWVRSSIVAKNINELCTGLSSGNKKCTRQSLKKHSSKNISNYRVG